MSSCGTAYISYVQSLIGHVPMVQVMVTDITHGAGASTAPLPAIQFLKNAGVKVMVDDALTSLTVAQVNLFNDCKRDQLMLVLHKLN